MGGDFAPANVVAGAVEALKETHNRFEIIFVGPAAVITDQLRRVQANGAAYRIVDAPEVIDMHDGATASLKQKKNSSIAVGMNLHRDGKADAFVSAGHSGAVMSASTLILGRIEGIGRPTIGAFFPSERGVTLLVDAGANVDCKPQHLYEFGVMGSIYTRQMFGVPSPTVGLLSIGEESSKGNDVVKETHKLFEGSGLNFVGNVEGRDILKGEVNVVVCDGFVGNILLKFAESVPSFLKFKVKQAAGRSAMMSVMGLMMKNMMRGVLRSMDYEEYGGVPILGVNGVSIIGHGKSTPKAIKNMIFKAEEMVLKNINGKIQEALVLAK
jgi:glycerol-3-phosphate acyltransferase PlsX